MERSRATRGFSTQAVHAGTYHDRETGGACSPVFTSTAFAFPNAAEENFYPRYFNTPSGDPVLRESSRLSCAGAAACQFSYDVFKWEELFGDVAAKYQESDAVWPSFTD